MAKVSGGLKMGEFSRVLSYQGEGQLPIGLPCQVSIKKYTDKKKVYKESKSIFIVDNIISFFLIMQNISLLNIMCVRFLCSDVRMEGWKELLHHSSNYRPWSPVRPAAPIREAKLSK